MFLLRSKEDESVPREGDVLVTLSCDPNLCFKDRYNLLVNGFYLSIQGSVLRRVERMDLENGVVKFILGGGANPYAVTGKVVTSIEKWQPDSPTKLKVTIER